MNQFSEQQFLSQQLATNINPIGLILLILCIIGALTLPREKAIYPFIVIGVLVTLGQRLSILEINFIFIRIMIFCYFFRIVIRRELSKVKLDRIDIYFLIWILIATITFVINWMQYDALINRLGYAYDSIGVFFIVRALVKTPEEIIRATRILIILTVIISIFMALEQLTNHNWLSLMGGVPEQPDIRGGRFRSQGPFPHSIPAGMFGAVMIPLAVNLYIHSKKLATVFYFASILSCFTIIVTSFSSGPIFGLFGVILGLFSFYFRKYLKFIRRGTVLILILLHLVMQAPVWALIHRIEIIVGSTGYHRYAVLNNFINRFSEWALTGVRSTDHWGFMMWDLTNEYIYQGVKGGLLTLILFIIIIWKCFKSIGINEAKHRIITKKVRTLNWCLGATMFGFVVCFMGVNLMGQMNFVWHFVLAVIVSLKVYINRTYPDPKQKFATTFN